MSLCSKSDSTVYGIRKVDEPGFIHEISLCRYRALDFQVLLSMEKLGLKRVFKLQSTLNSVMAPHRIEVRQPA